MNCEAPTQTLEDISTAAILSARQFAEMWGDMPRLIRNADDQEETLRTVHRFKSGDIFRPTDEITLDEVEKQLVDWFETLSRNRFLEIDGRAGVMHAVESEETKEVMSLLESYLTFRALRQSVFDQIVAEKALRDLRKE